MFCLHKVLYNPFDQAEQQDHMFSQQVKIEPVKWDTWTEADVNLYWDCIDAVILRVRDSVAMSGHLLQSLVF